MRPQPSRTRGHFGAEVARLLLWLVPPTAILQDPVEARYPSLLRLEQAPAAAQVVALADWYATVQQLDAVRDPVVRTRLHTATHTYLLPLADDFPPFASLYAGWAGRYPGPPPAVDGQPPAHPTSPRPGPRLRSRSVAFDPSTAPAVRA